MKAVAQKWLLLGVLPGQPLIIFLMVYTRFIARNHWSKRHTTTTYQRMKVTNCCYFLRSSLQRRRTGWCSTAVEHQCSWQWVTRKLAWWHKDKFANRESSYSSWVLCAKWGWHGSFRRVGCAYEKPDWYKGPWNKWKVHSIFASKV